MGGDRPVGLGGLCWHKVWGLASSEHIESIIGTYIFGHNHASKTS